MKLVLKFEVLGKPEPAGSKKGIPYAVAGHCRCNVIDDNDKAQDWKDSVGVMAKAAMKRDGIDMVDGFPVAVHFAFVVTRPKGDHRRGRNAGRLRDGAPIYPIKIPDVLKLARAVEDGMTGIVYRDDAQIVDEVLTKRYGKHPGVEISIYVLPRTVEDQNQWQTMRMPFRF